jgi:hypothetical protein
MDLRSNGCYDSAIIALVDALCCAVGQLVAMDQSYVERNIQNAQIIHCVGINSTNTQALEMNMKKMRVFSRLLVSAKCE